MKKGYTESETSGEVESVATPEPKSVDAEPKRDDAEPKREFVAAEKKVAQPNAAPADATPPEFDLAVTHQLNLDEVILRRSPFHGLPPLEEQRNDATLTQAMDLFLKKVRIGKDFWELDYSDVIFGYPIAKPVAHFWLATMTLDQQLHKKPNALELLDSVKCQCQFDGSEDAVMELIYEEGFAGVLDERAVLLLATRGWMQTSLRPSIRLMVFWINLPRKSPTC